MQRSKATGPVDVIRNNQPAGAESEAESEAEKGKECVWRSNTKTLDMRAMQFHNGQNHVCACVVDSRKKG